MSLITIGEFSHMTRLSPKALRLYDQLGLVVPARVDAISGYRLYSAEQVESARLVGMLRRIGMPLAQISAVLAMPPDRAAAAAKWVIEHRREPRPGPRQVYLVNLEATPPEVIGIDMTIALK